MEANLTAKKHDLIRRKTEAMYDSMKQILLLTWLRNL